MLGWQTRSQVTVKPGSPASLNVGRLGKAAFAPRFLVGHPHPVRPLRPREGGRHRDLRGIAKLPGHGLRAVYYATSPNADQEIHTPRLLRGLLDGASRCVLAHVRVGSGVLLPEHTLHPPDEVSLFVKGAPGYDEGPVAVPGLLFQLLQATGAEVDPAGRQGRACTSTHGLDSTLAFG